MKLPDKEKLIEKYFHELHGMVCQALTWSSRETGDLSRVMTRNAERIRAIVRQMVDDVYPPSAGDTKPEQTAPPPAQPPRGSPPQQRNPPGGR